MGCQFMIELPEADPELTGRRLCALLRALPAINEELSPDDCVGVALPPGVTIDISSSWSGVSAIPEAEQGADEPANGAKVIDRLEAASEARDRVLKEGAAVMGDVRITGSVNGVGFAALIDLTAGHSSKGGPGLCVGLDFLGAAPRKKQIQVEFDDMDDHAAIPELLDGLFRTLQPVFIGRHR